MLQPGEFIDLVSGLLENLPMAKAISEKGLTLAWLTFPDAAKQSLTSSILLYSCSQRMLDPDPNLKLAIQIQLLSYIYPMRDGQPYLDGGFRADLPQRMSRPYEFHPLTIVEAYSPPKLPEAPVKPPLFMTETPEERRKRLHVIAQQTLSFPLKK